MEREQQEREHKNTIKAALFVAGKALSAEELAAALGIPSIGYLNGLLARLVEDGKAGGDPLAVVKVGGKYELSVKEPYASKVNGLAGKPDITRGSLRILAYVSKNEPIMQSSVVRAFGSSTYGHIKELLEKDFVTAKRAGRTKRLSTTGHFKEYFSLGSAEQGA